MSDHEAESSIWAKTTGEIARIHERPPSFTNLLPWSDYDEEHQIFVLDDGISLAMAFEISPVSSEAVSQEYLEEVRDLVQVALVDALPVDGKNPWVLQVFIQDDFDLVPFQKTVAEYRDRHITHSGYSSHFERLFASHLQRLTREYGLYGIDEKSSKPWRGHVRRVRAILYQRLISIADQLNEPEQHLVDVSTRFQSALAVAGITCQRLDLRGFRNWMLPWLNPKTCGSSDNRESLSGSFKEVPSPLPLNYDVAQDLMLSQPVSDGASGIWWIEGLPHEVISVQGLRRTPYIGHLTAERVQGDRDFILLDELPVGTITALTIEVTSDQLIAEKVSKVKKSAVGDGAEALITRNHIDKVEHEIASGNRLFHVSLAFYLRASNIQELDESRHQLISLLLAQGIQPIVGEADLLKLDSYLRNLPMGFDPILNKMRRRSRMLFAKDVAALLPAYGRSRGLEQPGFVFFNRSAEPLCFDPLNPADRKKNAHLLLLGPTGSGKSATLTYLLQQVMASHKPRLYIIEAGGSFSLLGEYFRSHGLSVNQVTLNPDCDVSLPPFTAASKLAESLDLDSGRDYLSEMEIIAKIMITGGDAKELDRMTRADQLLIRTAILNASKLVKEEFENQVLTETVVAAINRLANSEHLEPSQKSRAAEMAASMELFCSGVAGHFFNRTGSSWPDADVTILELGLLARDGYEDQLSVAYLSLMAHIHDLVEARQHESRQTLVVTDEGHVILTHNMLSNYIVKITKMWRKFGAWFWIATQNLSDFSDDSKRMLSMIEWWLCLAISKDEVEQLERFKDITSDQRRLLLSAKKEPGKYVEGVVLSDEFEALFRNVPPALTLALSQSEKHEKAKRRELMDLHGCTEYEAAKMIADEMSAD